MKKNLDTTKTHSSEQIVLIPSPRPSDISRFHCKYINLDCSHGVQISRYGMQTVMQKFNNQLSLTNFIQNLLILTPNWKFFNITNLFKMVIG